MDEEDEILLALATVLRDFVDLVGGPSHAHVLLRPLEKLCGIEEPLVREKVRRKLARLWTWSRIW